MKVDSKNIEFGYELISVIPYAYYHYTQGNLKGTRSGNDSDPLYYFSPKHEINTEERKFGNISEVTTPNKWIHKPYLEKNEFKIPPYKKIYKNKEYKFKKETVVICNRANIEWNYKMINYFDVPTLRNLFTLLQDKYQIVYINVEGRKELYDGIEPEKIGDFELLKEFPKVINFHDLVKNSWNETQLKVFANCQKFITMNGGHSILASYFGGENIIMSRYDKIHARELDKGVNSFYTFYHEFNGSRCVHVKNEIDLIKRVKLQWIDKEPIVNILIRTSNRPEYFRKCMRSIEVQTYKNINIFVSIDNRDKYTIPYRVYPIKVKKKNVKPVKKDNNYGMPFPSNLYFNELHKHVKKGLIIYLDDDDHFTDGKAIEKIVNQYKKGKELIFWKVKIDTRFVPSKNNWKKIVCKDISGIGIAFDQKYKIKWEGYKRGDYRVIKELNRKIKDKIWINQTLTGTQSKAGWGFKLDKNQIDMEYYKIKFTNADKGSKFKNGEIVELKAHVAKQFVINGKAVFHEEKKKVVKPNQVTKKKTVKRGRPKKSA